METSQAKREDLPSRILLFDGVCGLCNHLVQFCLRADKKRALRYAPLQGETAARLRALYTEIPEGLDSVVLVDGDAVYLRSRAVLGCANYLGWPWRLARLFRWVPRVIADAAYNLVARTRYRIFGRFEVCRVPSREERELFLP